MIGSELQVLPLFALNSKADVVNAKIVHPFPELPEYYHTMTTANNQTMNVTQGLKLRFFHHGGNHLGHYLLTAKFPFATVLYSVIEVFVTGYAENATVL